MPASQLLIAAMIGAQGAPPASAPAEPEQGAVAEIIVTGERRRRTVRDTASSVEVYTADRTAAEPGADRLDQLLEQTPNVTLGTTNLGPTIRGDNSTGVLQDLPAFLGGTRQRVTLQVDGRAVGFNEFLSSAAPLWDVEQIEIYRSPQSTTQGRNSIAGAIFVETSDPTYAPEARARAITGDLSMTQISAMASGPVIDGQIAMRIAGDLRHARPSSDIADRMIGADPDNDDYGLLRVKLLAEPRSLPGSRFELTYAHTESKAPQVEGVRAPFEDRADPIAPYGIFANRVDSATARASVGLTRTLRLNTTASFGDSFIRRFAPPGLGQARTEVQDWSLETIADWRPSDSFSLIAGFHRLGTALEQDIDVSAAVGTGSFRDRQGSTGLFGEATIRPLAKLKLNLGLRYQRDTQRRTGAIGNELVEFPLDYDETVDAWLPKLSLAYDFDESFTGGLLIQRAYNPGGTTVNFDTGEPETFGAERALSYELFARAALGRARLTANLFYTRYRDAQRAQSRAYSVPGGGTAFWAEIENVPRARSLGAEAAVDWQATNRLKLSAGAGLLDTRTTEAAPASPLDGKEFQRAPHLTLSGFVDWRPIDPLRLSISARRHSAYFSDDENRDALRIQPATIVNGRAAFDLGRFTLFGYARNLFDIFYMSHLGSANFGTAVDPRELGIGLEARF